MAQQKFRKFFNDTHLWLGLASGLILFVVCLTGTIYTFRTEIDEFLNKDLFFVAQKPDQQSLNVDQLINQIQIEKEATVSTVTIPSAPNRAWTVGLKPKMGEKGRGQQVLVNPYTGRIQGTTETEASKFFGTIMKMHRWLLMEQATGRIIVGIATIIFTFLLLSGIILWLPRRLRYWKQGFVILFSGKWKRINHDLHNVLGFYSFFILLIMALTGLCWSFEWYKDGASKVLGAPVFGQKKEKPIHSQISAKTIIEPSAALTIAQAQLKGSGTVRLSMPVDSMGSFMISKNNDQAWNSSAIDRVFVDAYSGEVIKLDLYANKSLGQKIAASIRPIHTGEIYGWFSKLIYFICCLIATSLPVTGTIIWLNKLRRKSRVVKATPSFQI